MFAGRTVLIAEDNDDCRYSMWLLLSSWGHVVKVAANGPEAIVEARSLQPDIAILDLGLPGCSGYEVAKQLRAALGSGTVLIACTGYGSDEARSQAAEAGFDHYLVKPAEVNALQSCMAGDNHRTNSGHYLCGSHSW